MIRVWDFKLIGAPPLLRFVGSCPAPLRLARTMQAEKGTCNMERRNIRQLATNLDPSVSD
jgi:hypothetical protein